MVILGVIGLEMEIYRTSGSDLGGGQDLESKIEMIWAYEEEMHGCSST